ncbi:MAG: dihydrodipicolinate synthase family protein [Desulfovibrio sp.]|jgi:4-hydroxy-tetrahydrodipicolinate synthase|nr:dihydrodipicolinate synthase family protein [Desulfovibrio sp.]
MSELCRLRGVLSPVLTPFKEDLSPDPVRYIEHCRWLLDSGVSLAVFGTNSEANSLSLSERQWLLDVLLEAGVPPSSLLPGTGCCSFPETVELSRKATAAGCAGVLVLPPFYYKNVSDEGLFNSYSEIVQRVGDARLRIYLYHIPPIAQVPISLGLIERLLKAYPVVIAGIKDSSGDWDNTDALLRNFQSEAFDVFCGSEVFLLRTLRGGGAGCITATGNVNPAAIVELYRTWREAGADGKQAALTKTRGCFETLPMIASMKSCIAWKRKVAEWATVRPPLVRVSAEKAEGLQKLLDADGFAMPGV